MWNLYTRNFPGLEVEQMTSDLKKFLMTFSTPRTVVELWQTGTLKPGRWQTGPQQTGCWQIGSSQTGNFTNFWFYFIQQACSAVRKYSSHLWISYISLKLILISTVSVLQKFCFWCMVSWDGLAATPNISCDRSLILTVFEYWKKMGIFKNLLKGEWV